MRFDTLRVFDRVGWRNRQQPRPNLNVADNVEQKNNLGQSEQRRRRGGNTTSNVNRMHPCGASETSSNWQNEWMTSTDIHNGCDDDGAIVAGRMCRKISTNRIYFHRIQNTHTRWLRSERVCGHNINIHDATDTLIHSTHTL